MAIKKKVVGKAAPKKRRQDRQHLSKEQKRKS